ncbi:MAG: hypothetical protein GY816_03980 [Cytophagales bacterium]|nr:hypothetical protein [Cytophagales bacterium]
MPILEKNYSEFKCDCPACLWLGRDDVPEANMKNAEGIFQSAGNIIKCAGNACTSMLETAIQFFDNQLVKYFSANPNYLVHLESNICILI